MSEQARIELTPIERRVLERGAQGDGRHTTSVRTGISTGDVSRTRAQITEKLGLPKGTEFGVTVEAARKAGLI